MVISCISDTFILTFPSTSFQILLLTSCPVLFFCIPNSPINPSHMCYSDMHGGIVILESYHHIRDHAFKENWLSLLQRAPFLITPHLSFEVYETLYPQYHKKDYFDLVLVFCRQPLLLWVHKDNHSTVPRRHCFVIWHLVLSNVLDPFLRCLLILEERGI